MIPPSPAHFALFGPALYGELYVGLCRALAAPWLDPGWLAPAQAGQRPPRAGAARPPANAVSSERADAGSAAAGQVIEVPVARWRARRDRNGSSGAS